MTDGERDGVERWAEATPADPDDRQLLSTPTRQSPVAVVFIALRFLRNLGAVNIVFALVVLGSGRLPFALLGVGVAGSVVLLAYTVAAWWRFVFTIEADELLVAKGVVAQERLTIPLDRVQSVSINQRFLHRLIGLVSVTVETAGSSDAELEIDAVDRGRAEALQRLAAGHRRVPPPPTPSAPAGAPGSVPLAGPPDGQPPAPGIGADGWPPPVVGDPIVEQTLVARTPIELVKVGLARWPWAGLAALAPLFVVAGELGDLLPVDIDGEQLIEDNLPDEVGRALVLAVIGLALVGIVIGAVLGVILQVVQRLVTDWDLRLTRNASGLRRTAGLLSRTSRASTLNRIQAMRIDETPMQRLFGIRRLALPTIGEGDLVIPGATADEVTRIRAEVFGDAPPPPLDRTISPLAVFLAVRNRVLGTIPLTALAVATIGWWGLAVLAAIPLGWLTARRQWRLRRWGITDDRVAELLELINRQTAEIELIKAQTVTVRQSFFERRRGLATVAVTTAEGHLAVPLIPIEEAKAARDLALFRVETDRRAWM